MGRIDPYKDVKKAVDQLDKHFNDVYRVRYTVGMYRLAEYGPSITPKPDLEEVIINVSLNPKLKYTST